MDYGEAAQWRSNQPGASIVDGCTFAADLSRALVFCGQKTGAVGIIKLAVGCNLQAARRSQEEALEPAAMWRLMFLRFSGLTDVLYGSD